MALLMHSAAHPGAHDAHTSSAGLVACFIERENRGFSRLESFFLWTIFHTSTKSFPFGVLGWLRRRERAIKLMNGGLMDFIPLPRRKTREIHIRFSYMFWEFEKVTYDWWQCLVHHNSTFSKSSRTHQVWTSASFFICSSFRNAGCSEWRIIKSTF